MPVHNSKNIHRVFQNLMVKLRGVIVRIMWMKKCHKTGSRNLFIQSQITVYIFQTELVLKKYKEIELTLYYY